MTLNLVAFDDVLTKKENWISPKYKKLYSTILPNKDYFVILKRYNTRSKETDYYLLLSDVMTPDKQWLDVIHNNGYNRYDLKDYWKELGVKGNKDVEINVSFVEGDDDMMLYYLDI